MTYSVVNHRLHKDGKPVAYRPTPWVGGALRPRFLVMHFTAGSYAGAVSWLTDPKQPKDRRASAHLVVSEGGEVTQLAPFDRVTWHAGRSQWRGINGLNAHSIGIEIANMGQLRRVGDSWYAGQRAVDSRRVVEARHANGGPVVGWQTYTPAQLEAVKAIGVALCRAYPFEDVLGHDQISPGRKTDPGPAFPMEDMRAAIVGTGSNWPTKADDRSGGTPKPLTKSRTLAGASMSAVGLMGEQVSEAARQIEPLIGMSDWLKWGFLALTVAGIGLVIWARVSDSFSHEVK